MSCHPANQNALVLINVRFEEVASQHLPKGCTAAMGRKLTEPQCLKWADSGPSMHFASEQPERTKLPFEAVSTLVLGSSAAAKNTTVAGVA